MGQLTDAGATRIYDMLLKGTLPTIASPGSWFTLFTTGPSHSGSGDVELGSYSRVSVSAWTYAGTWPNLTATLTTGFNISPMPSCTVTGWGLSTDPTAGELLYFEQLAVADNFTSGDRYVVPAGAIIVDLSTV